MPFFGQIFISMPGHAVPVGVGRGIVAISAGQAAIRTVVEIAETPRATKPRVAGGIKGAPNSPLHRSIDYEFCEGPAAPLAPYIIKTVFLPFDVEENANIMVYFICGR